MKRALFLDRDGVINIDHGYVSKIEDFEFVEGVLDLIREAQKRGYIPIVVTKAQERFGIDMAASWMIGDKPGDIEAAKRAGVGHTYLTPKNSRIDIKDLHGF